MPHLSAGRDDDEVGVLLVCRRKRSLRELYLEGNRRRGKKPRQADRQTQSEHATNQTTVRVGLGMREGRMSEWRRRWMS